MSSPRGRVFVLGVAVAFACGTEEPAGHDDGGSTGHGTTSAEASSEGTSGGTSTSGSSGEATDGGSTAPGSSSGSSSLGSSTAADEGSTGGRETLGTTGEPPSACQQGCAVQFQCTTEWTSEEECVTACEANLVRAAAFAPSCADAWENVSECVGALTCEELLEWQMPTTFPYPCVEADQVLQFECKGQ